jgi:capsular exopolysaccharide synthesis family protein
VRNASLLDLRDMSTSASETSEPSIATRTFGDPTDRRLIVHPQADQVFVEQFRSLGAALHHAQIEEGIRSLMVTSGVGGEGKTLSATNLALMLSRSFRKRVLLVDADLRKPSVHQLLRLENHTGLSDILKRPAEPLTAQALSPTLSVITGGERDADPVSLLVSAAATRFLSTARDHFDWIVVDTPPVLLFPDAGLFADRVDTCVMVVNTSTTAAVAARALAAIGASRTLGIVLNRAEPTEIAAGYGYGQYGQPKSGGASKKGEWWRSLRTWR